MLQPNSSAQPRQQRSIWALIRLFAGVLLIAAGITLAIRHREPATRNQKPRPTLTSTIAPASSRPSAETSPIPTIQGSPGSDGLGLTLEEFQSKYEALSGKAGEQEAFFKNCVGKKVTWTVKVDHVFRAENGVIVVFSLIDRPDWAAFPISDARFPVQLESRLMLLARGELIKLEGKIVYQGIKTLECTDFQIAADQTDR